MATKNSNLIQTIHDVEEDELFSTYIEEVDAIEEINIEEQNVIEEQSEVEELSGEAASLWLDKPTRLLISLVGGLMPKIGKSQSLSNKGKMWRIIQNKMNEENYKFSIKQIQNKYFALERGYKKAVAHNNKTGRNRIISPYEKELGELFNIRPAVFPPYLLGVRDSSQPSTSSNLSSDVPSTSRTTTITEPSTSRNLIAANLEIYPTSTSRTKDVIEISDSDTSNPSEDGDDENDDSYIVFCKNLTQNITEEILYELFLQCGPVENVMIPKNSNGSPKTFAFIKFVHKCSVPYCLQLLDRTKLFGQPIYLNTRRKNFKTSTNLSSGTNGNSSYIMSENNLSMNNTNNLYMNNNIESNPLNIIKRSSLAVATARTALRTAFRSADIAEITAATVAEVIPKILSIQPTQILPHYPHPRVFQQDFDQFSNFVRVINGVHNDPNFMYLPYM